MKERDIEGHMTPHGAGVLVPSWVAPVYREGEWCTIVAHDDWVSPTHVPTVITCSYGGGNTDTLTLQLMDRLDTDA